MVSACCWWQEPTVYRKDMPSEIWHTSPQVVLRIGTKDRHSNTNNNNNDDNNNDFKK